MPSGELKSRIDDGLTAAGGYVVTQWGDSSLRGLGREMPEPVVMCRPAGAVIVDRLFRTAVEVTMLLAPSENKQFVSGDGVEPLMLRLISDLNSVPDCFPSVVAPTVNYAMSVDGGRTFIAVTVRCLSGP